jgi:RNA polymerase sigma-54 factor
MMKQALQLRIGQQLTMTPQLQQAIRLLQLPVVELNAELQQALAENVMLEAEEAPDTDFERLDIADGRDPVTDGSDDYPTDYGSDRLGAGQADGGDDASGDELPAADATFSDVATGDGGDPGDAGPWSDLPAGGNGPGGDGSRPEPADTSHDSLRDHLLWQLELEDFTPREIPLGQALIDALNEAGYLTEPLDAVLATLDPAAGYTLAELEAALGKVQALDPAGIAARSLGECIALQLRLLAADTPALDLALRIAAEALDLVAAGELSMLRRRFGADETEIEAALRLVRNCHPKPGLSVQTAITEYVIPDVYVRKRDGRWSVDINRGLAPRLRVNQAYADMVRGDGDHAVLRNQLQEARWLVRSLEIRNETLLKVATCIVERQAAFLDHGDESMRPMVLRDVAEAVAMHESTISRVTSSKYMHTPRGVFEFRHFFSSQVTGDDGSEQSSTAIRARIRKLVAQENPARPLSDSALADLLGKEGIQVARRTVAKYREALGIEPSSERRRRPTR